MSATGRGRERAAFDDYPTPDWCVRRLLETGAVPATRPILDPCAGDGALLRAIREFYGEDAPGMVAVELRDECRSALETIANTSAHIGNFFTTPGTVFPPYGTVVTNPPYSLATEFLQVLLTRYPKVCMLLRLNFLGGTGRADMLRKHTPDVYVLPNRPSFRRDEKGRAATDACEYGWFVWDTRDRGRAGRVVILPETSREERQVCAPGGRSVRPRTEDSPESSGESSAQTDE